MVYAYPQWIELDFYNAGGTAFAFKNIDLSYGKFYERGNKDKEIPVDFYEGKVVNAGDTIPMNSCGRESSPSGTTCKLQLVDNSTGKVFCTIYWDCPWGSSSNSWSLDVIDGLGWMVSNSPPLNLKDGALGYSKVTVFKIPAK